MDKCLQVANQTGLETANQFWGYYMRVNKGWLYNEHYQIGPAEPVDGAGTWSETDHCFIQTATREAADPHFHANPWPAEAVVPGFRSEMEGLHTALEAVGHVILRALIRALRPEDNDIAISQTWAQHPVSTLRAMHYPWPPPPNWAVEPHDLAMADGKEAGRSGEEGSVITAGAHCDNGTGISLLWQSDDGLQVAIIVCALELCAGLCICPCRPCLYPPYAVLFLRKLL